VGEAGAVFGRQNGGRVVTSVDIWELVLVAVLIVVAALLAAAEAAITRMGRIRAYHLEEEGRRGARALARITENPARYLNVVLLLVLLVQLGGTTLATVVAVRHLHGVG
jgi:Mg2+/Co2+ transporter CorB